MTYSLLELYFKELRDIHSTGAAVKETSYYPALSALLNNIGGTLKPKVYCILTLSNIGAGLPDGGLFTPDQFQDASAGDPISGQLPNRGAIEIKSTGDDAWLIADSDQVTKYWSKYKQVLVSNYCDFILVGRDHNGNPVKLETYRLAKSEQDFWARVQHPQTLAAQHESSFIEFIQRIMLHAVPLSEPKEVAWFLASYARTAMTRIECHDLVALSPIRTPLEEALGLKFVGDKGEHFFRSTFVQTLFYGIFSAWVLWCKKHPPISKEQFRWQDTAWELKVPVVQKLFYMMSDPNALLSLNVVEILEWTANVLNRVERSDFFTSFETGKTVQYFYEPFLEAFDPELRKELGVWYTPPEVVHYMVERVDTVLREELGIADGFADPNVYVLDPCCGTGSYLIEVLRRIHKTFQEKQNDALLATYIKAAAIKRVFGFEILPAPYVVSHLNLGLLLQELGSPLSEMKHERAAVYLTNALTGWEPLDPEKEKAFQSMLVGFPELLAERDSAREVKREKPILVVLGNPPYNAFSGVAPTDEEQKLVAAYKQGLTTIWKIKKFNLDDPYVRFFRMAEHRIIDQTDQGIVCFISNFSYLNDPSFVVMREHFIKEFDRLWFDNMNGDSRETGKKTPEGKPDPSIFSTEYNQEGIRVGTSIGLMVRKNPRDSESIIRYRQFWGTNKRINLSDSLNVTNINSYYDQVPKNQKRSSFRLLSGSQEYPTWPSISDLAAEQPFATFMEARRGTLINIDKNNLESRMKAYYNKKIDWQAYKALHLGLSEDAPRFDAEKARSKIIQSEEYSDSRFQRYALHPMDIRWCYYSPIRPLWNEPRPDLWDQCFESNQFVITRLKTEKEAKGSPLYFSHCLVDWQCIARNVSVIPIRLRKGHKINKESKTVQMQLPGSEKKDEPFRANLSLSVQGYLNYLGIADLDKDYHNSGIIWKHALAISYSTAYLDENKDLIRQDWPRIPLPDNRELLEESALLGDLVAGLLDTEKNVSNVTTGQIRDELKSLGIISRCGGGHLQDNDLVLTAGWGHIQSDAIMPGRGKFISREYTSDERLNIETGTAKLGFSPNEWQQQLGDSTFDIYLNNVAYWRNIPIRVWEYYIGGFQVMKKWLSYREQTIINRPLTIEEINHFTNMSRRIAAILLLEPKLNDNYQNCKFKVYPWTNKQ